MKNFTERVLDVVKGIPKGTVLSYKQVAIRAGSPNAVRAVGTAMKNNYDPIVPCHRVIRSDGSIGMYNRGIDKKKALLAKEGYILK